MINENLLQDYKGLKLYPNVLKKIKINEFRLEEAGYHESKKKPLLYYRKVGEDYIFFADMRGTDEVPIWTDTTPLFYCMFLKDTPKWKKIRIIEEEEGNLASYKVNIRYSFYEECEPDGLFFSKENGYCKLCGKDFQDDGEFCSEQCSLAHEEGLKPVCFVCGLKKDYDNIINHHISYKPEKIINVCKSCHLRIHRGDKYSNLKPKEKK